MEAQQQDLSLYCDDSYISLLLAENNHPAEHLMSDETYAEELQLQEAIMSSLVTPTNVKIKMEIGEPSSSLSSSSSMKVKIKMEIGESSSSQIQKVCCEICVENKEAVDFIPIQNCAHKFCTICISKHVSIRVRKGNIGERLECPGMDCKGFLDISTCRGIVPGDVISAWDEMLCESMISATQKLHCPNKSCSGLVVNDSGGVITEAECPFCHKLFCAECRVPWHAGISCVEFRGLNASESGKEELMVHELAKRNKWQRCPKCNFFVEKTEGCLHITCRCAFEFCYSCGKAWSSSHDCQ